MSLHLNEQDMILQAVQAVPMESIDLVSQSLNGNYLERYIFIVFCFVLFLVYAVHWTSSVTCIDYSNFSEIVLNRVSI